MAETMTREERASRLRQWAQQEGPGSWRKSDLVEAARQLEEDGKEIANSVKYETHAFAVRKAEEYLARATSAEAEVTKLRAALGTHCIHQEYDFPGDSPVPCGWYCEICTGHGDSIETIKHEPDCALLTPENPHA